MRDVIRVEGLSRAFGDCLALDGLDLAVDPGSITCFLGPNGAGKSTTIRILLGLQRADAGQVEVLGLPPGDLGAMARIGSLVESPSLYPELTGLDNLRVAALYRGCGDDACRDALRDVGLEDSGHRKVKGYSMGMRQRMGLALALVHRPELLILDEPTNGLDPAGIVEIRELLRNLALERGVSIFLSSHLLAEVEQLATHVVVVHRGRKRFQGTLDALQEGTKPILNLVVDDPERAERILASFHVDVESPGGGAFRVRLPDEGDVARINSALVLGGCGVVHSALERPNLEARFLALTESV